MDRVTFVFLMTVASCVAKQVYFDLSNDPNYPQMVSLSNVRYTLAANQYIDISATLTVYEEIDEGTNIKINVPAHFPYARILNNIDVSLCVFCRKELSMYNRLIVASNGQLPDRCPIKPGVYNIENLRIDIDKWPLLWRAADTSASITLHKNGRIMTKFNLKSGIQATPTNYAA